MFFFLSRPSKGPWILLNVNGWFKMNDIINQRVWSGDEDQTRVQFYIYHIPQPTPKISSLNALLRQNSWYLCMPFDCSAVSRAPEFRSEIRLATNNEWHTTDDVTSCNTCRRRHWSDVAPRSCIAMTSWNSGALETAAQQWGLSPDQHFVWSDIFITQQIGILGRAIFVSCIFAYFS
jgi:hypothetical protein